MKIVHLWLAFILFSISFLTIDCKITNYTDDCPKTDEWENVYTRIKDAKNITQVLEASTHYRNTCRDEANEIHHDLAQFFCAITISRMNLDDTYTKEVRPNISSTPPGIDENAAIQDWKNLLRENRTDGLAGRIHEAYRYIIPFDDSYIDEFAESVVKSADLCRRYEPKIMELLGKYENQLQNGSRMSLTDIMGNYTDWSVTIDDVYAVNRIHEAQNIETITWSWLDEENKKVIPFCASRD